MKKQFSTSFGNVVRKTLLRFGLTGLMAVTLMPAMVQAQDKGRTTPPVVAINYIGSVDNQPVFQIEFENKNEEVLSLFIRDEQGTILFNEKFKDKKFSKKFQFDKAGLDNMKLTFTLAGEKEKQSQSFEINTNVRVIQDVVVTRL
jgi:hypothetical protein